MSNDFLNLYKITFDLKNNEFTVFESLSPLDRKTINRVRYALFKRYSLPVIFREGKFFVYGKVDDHHVEIPLSEEIAVLLKKKGIETVEEFKTEEEVQNFIRDMLEAHEVPKKFAQAYVRKNNLKLRGKFGDIYFIPYPQSRVFKRGNDFLLMVDVRFRLVLKHSLQQLLDEGLISVSDVYNLRLKPKNYDFTSKATDIKKASELGREFVQSKLKYSRGKLTRKYWSTILKYPKIFEKTYVVFLGNNYVYPAGMLNVVIDFKSVEKEITDDIMKFVKLSPKERIKLIRELLQKYRSVLTPWGINLGDEEQVDGKIPYNNTLVDSTGKTTKIETNMRHFLSHLKPFVKNPKVSTLVLIVDRTYDKQLFLNRKNFLKDLQSFLENKGINLLIGKQIHITARTRSEALKEVNKYLEEMKRYNLVLIFLEEYGRVDPYTQETLLYDHIKKNLLEGMIPSQVVLNTTLKRMPSAGWKFVILNVAEQIMAKTGNIPYKIEDEIPQADYFIGIDISRVTRGNTVNVGAFTKIFAKDGTFLKYKLLSEIAFGESISRKAIQELFLTLSEMKVEEGAKIVIHRDGRFQKDEAGNFIEFAKEFNYKIELVEIIKRGNPRIFPAKGTKIKGDFYKLNDNTLILATYNNIYQGTHQPLRIQKVFGELPIETLASQVLSLTLMNYSSFQPIKLPATTHYADKITKLLLRGIEPAQREGDIMYWL